MGAIDAAITKLGANLFLATKISFANELAEICDAFGADVSTVVDGMSYDSRIGGSLPARRCRVRRLVPARTRSSMTIRTAAQAGVDTPLLTAVDEVNHRRRSQVVERAASLLEGTVRGRRVALLGLTFKPDTDDLRDAPALTIASELIEQAPRSSPMTRCRPRASARRASCRGSRSCTAAADALRGADAAVLVTEWPEFVDLDWAVAGMTMSRRIVIDGRNVLTGERLPAPGSRTRRSAAERVCRTRLPDGASRETARVASLQWGRG